jgi:hypothetical protein
LCLQTCVADSDTEALAVCTGKWLGGDNCDRCESATCEDNSECRSTNDNVCDEGEGDCPPWTDENDCSGSRFNTFNGGCEHLKGTTCGRCMEAVAVGGGYCGWNPETSDCMTSRITFDDGYGRSASSRCTAPA